MISHDVYLSSPMAICDSLTSSIYEAINAAGERSPPLLHERRLTHTPMAPAQFPSWSGGSRPPTVAKPLDSLQPAVMAADAEANLLQEREQRRAAEAKTLDVFHGRLVPSGTVNGTKHY